MKNTNIFIALRTIALNKFPSKQSRSFRGGKNCVPHFRAGGNHKAYKHSEITIVDEQRI
jgi:hypothetical protein